jgi:carboxyl-terminal processing protease
MPLSNGNGIKVTTSYYYIKSGRCIHKMSNDNRLKGEEVSADELNKESEENHNKKYYTSKNREVFGGGGINPDIEVENDFLTLFSAELRRKNVFFNFAVDYLVDHDHNLGKNPVITDKLMQDFLSYAKKQDITYTLADLDSSRAYIENTIKSELVRKVHGDQEAYKITVSQDKQLLEAVKLFDRFKTLDEMFVYAESQKKQR